MKPSLTLVLGLCALAMPGVVNGQPPAWTSAGSVPASLGQPAPAAVLGTPLVAPQPAATALTARAAPPAVANDPLVGDYSPAARLGPISELRSGSSPAPEALTTAEERYNWGIPDPAPASANQGSPLAPAPQPLAPAPRPNTQPPSFSQSKFGEQIGEFFNTQQPPSWLHFESDHCFDSFISPLSNPFLNEDPRTLTELRPIFMFQTIPSGQYFYHGGNIEEFNLQARLAITERLSIVMNKFGLIVINPGNSEFVGSASGITEIWLGPKYNFYREDQTGTLASAGLTFQVPIGPDKVFQNTGSLTLNPYANVAQQFGKSSYGTFHAQDTFGIAIATDNARSNYFYNSIHVDFDVANWQRIYPLLELNWFHYTQNGGARDLGFEGFDLANIGAQVAGQDFMSIAFGSRFKASEAVQFGIAAELPLLGHHDLQNFRLTIDMIWRY